MELSASSRKTPTVSRAMTVLVTGRRHSLMYDYAAAPRRTASLGKPLASFFALSALWGLLLLLFNRLPEIDLSIARSVFTSAPCSASASLGDICGKFAYDKAPFFVLIRNITLTLPYIAIAVLLSALYLA
ncbi:MAG: hypothetical protein KGI75_30275, partial [Rhizobiaceae bacterium]|nr:hypothetical protein [Rhizobiaceae bacterium]